MTFFHLFRRDLVFYRRPFAILTAMACLCCAIPTAALLIGDSVRGTLYDNLECQVASIRRLIRLPYPVKADTPDGVLHTKGFAPPGIKIELYALQQDAEIQGNDAWANPALAKRLNLKDGDFFTVRTLTIPAIPAEELMGRPPELKQIRFRYRGIWHDARRNVNFENPQLNANNLFVNHDYLAQALGVEENAINEIWASDEYELSNEMIWNLSRLSFSDWDGRPILKSSAWFLPERIRGLFPNATGGITTFAESLSDGQHQLDYFFVSAFENDIFPIETDCAVLSDNVSTDFPNGGKLSFFSMGAYRKLTRETVSLQHIRKTSDAHLGQALNPEAAGLTDVESCTDWDAGIPIDFDKVRQEDKDYWDKYKSKPKLYLNFQQAQQWFSPGKYTVLIFEKGANISDIRKKIINELRHDATLYRADDIKTILSNNIRNGVQFAPLFLGLSMFLIFSALLALSMMVKLHLFDRRKELSILSEYTDRIHRFLFMEIIAILLPGIIIGSILGTVLCQLQLWMLERFWNGVILMEQLHFHWNTMSYLLGFGLSFLPMLVIILHALRHDSSKTIKFCFCESRKINMPVRLGVLSFMRRLRHYRACIIILVLGFLGTLGVGAFGIKARGEDAFGWQFVMETILPFVPSTDQPFPDEVLPVRVFTNDSADCSNVLQASVPTVYGCDLSRLTHDGDFLQKMSAAVDMGSLYWIMKKRLGDSIAYPNGNITLSRTMKASVFQRGILVGDDTFQSLFPDVQGARFFLIKDKQTAEKCKQLLEPYGLSTWTVDEFMSEAERFQNHYLAIFLQLGVLGFLLGFFSLLLLMLRNLHAERKTIRFLLDMGLSQSELYRQYLAENMLLFMSGAIPSLILLGILSFFADLHVPTLLFGWLGLTAIGLLLISAMLSAKFKDAP
ncbi:MAG: ABC transporter permease [Victivallales bacterium]|nr:ABC transporter permease [Victivallales bacterium]